MLEIIGGWDPREVAGYNLCAFSAIRRTSVPIRFVPLMEKALRYAKLYRRQHEERDGQLWDVLSEAPMATSFAVSRFLAPWLAAGYCRTCQGARDPSGRWLPGGAWVLSCDFADMLFLADPAELFALADDRYAVMVVKHRHIPDETVKMDGQAQTAYARKNWSSVILWNLRHPAQANLTLDMVNGLPGRDLHRFCWLADHEIGELNTGWNYLVGVDDLTIKPSLLHFTNGTPEVGRYDQPWSDTWLNELAIMDASRARIRAA